ncbi:SprT-like family-domain-containing protein [Pisolithus croceorrhizus]|nr:SprT-like family-domain-containing protein [Pisolithus croceorrhizus]
MLGNSSKASFSKDEEDPRACTVNPSIEVIEISSDSDSDMNTDGLGRRNVIELTDSDTSLELPDLLSPIATRSRHPKTPGRTSPTARKYMPLYADMSDDGSDDDVVLTQPERMSYPTKKNTEHGLPTAPEGESDTLPVPARSPRKKAAPTSAKKSSTRISKKVRDAAEQFRREKYAANLFAELNHTVFGDGLPKDTKLEWNKRLLSTAGRARWYRSRDGIQATKIELATKILDCDERIRNTLSHEMCHLACWVIDKNPREGHGQLFKSWYDSDSSRTRHNYQIMHPYQWSQCISPSSLYYDCHVSAYRRPLLVCGVCKVGKLIPLFSRQMNGAQRTGVMASLIPSGEDTSKDTQLAIPVSPSLSAEEVLADALEHLSIERREF